MEMAVCCPDKPKHCKDMCKPCYDRARHKRYYSNPKVRARAAVRSKQWAMANPERVYELDANKHLIRNYGITLEQYKEVLPSQNGVCALCSGAETMRTRKKICRLAVDHCHKTGRIRGLLCFRCNTAIAFFESNPEVISNLTCYLKE